MNGGSSVSETSSGLCKAVGVFGNFGALSSFFWYYVITNNCISAIKGKTGENLEPRPEQLSSAAQQGRRNRRQRGEALCRVEG